MAFTGNKDVDRMIMSRLSDEDSFKFCQTNKYIATICNSEELEEI